MVQLLRGLGQVFFLVGLTGLKVDGSKEVGHLELVGERFVSGAQADFDREPTVEPRASSTTVRVVDEELNEVMLIDKNTAKKEHIIIMTHVLEV